MMIQKHSIIIVYLCLSINAGVLQVHADGPNNITRNEGEENIQVDCPLSLIGAPIWRINDSLLDLASIEVPLIPTRFGITITLVTRNIDQTRFQCFAPTGNGLHVRASDVGTLTVVKQDNYQPPLIEPPPYITLDYQGFDFNTTHRTVAWKFLNNQTCTPPVTFTIQSLSCDTDSSIGTWTTNTNFYSLPTEAFINNGDNLLYLSITASSTHAVECARLPTYIQVFPNVSSNELSVAIGNSSCIEVPPVLARQSLYVAWPGDPDCICPLCNDGNCVLANCQCYSRSSFAPELNTGTSGNNILCWSNLITSKNNSKIHFFAETTACNGSHLRSGPVFSKRFIGSSKFLVRGPPSTPRLSVSSMPRSFSTCFSSYSYYQIKQYSINVTDFTGDLLFTRDIPEPSTELCFEHDMRNYPVECTPFNITVKAYNDVGASNISHKELILGTPNMDYCTCIQKKAKIDYTIVRATITELSLHISCTMIVLYSKDVARVTIEVAYQQDFIVQRLPLVCNGVSTTLTYSNLKSGTTYLISAVWTTEDNSICSLGNAFTMPSSAISINLGLHIIGLMVGLPLTCSIINTI